MAAVAFEGRSYLLEAGESVLDGLLRHGLTIPHACKAGSCGSCLLRAKSGGIPPRAQAGLKDAWKAQGLFLACVAVPEGDLEIDQPGEEARTPARIAGLDMLSESVLRVRIESELPFDYRAGQYLTLSRELPDGTLSRSYSIASLPGEEFLELHVRLIPDGRMSGWLSRQAAIGDPVTVAGPMGECFYVPGLEDQPLLLAGTGTGLAPLYGVLRDALRAGHRGPIRLFHGARHPSGLYLKEALTAICREHPNVAYQTALRDANAGADELDGVVFSQLSQLSGWRAFFCGDPALVQRLKKRAFLAGAALKQIHSDAFLPSARHSETVRETESS